MTDDQMRIVWERVAGYLSSKDGNGLDIGNPSHLQLLVDYVRSELSGVAEDDLRVVVAMCWLGPHAATIPPTAMRQHLLDILRQYVLDEKERRERTIEFAIAYGCGKWRKVQPGYGGWEQRWQGAMRGIVRALEPAVAQANRWLAEHVVGFPQNRNTPQNGEFPEDTAVWSDAWVLATQLVQPESLLHTEEDETITIKYAPAQEEAAEVEIFASVEGYHQIIPPGAKLIWTIQEGRGELVLANRQAVRLTSGAIVSLLVRDDDAIIKILSGEHSQQGRLKGGETAKVRGVMTLAIWECTCGTTHCRENHRLEAWNPTQRVQRTVSDNKQKEETALALWSFVASAVKGPHVRIQTGSFVQGLYFPLLALEGCES